MKILIIVLISLLLGTLNYLLVRRKGYTSFSYWFLGCIVGFAFIVMILKIFGD